MASESESIMGSRGKSHDKVPGDEAEALFNVA